MPESSYHWTGSITLTKGKYKAPSKACLGIKLLMLLVLKIISFQKAQVELCAKIVSLIIYSFIFTEGSQLFSICEKDPWNRKQSKGKKSKQARGPVRAQSCVHCFKSKNEAMIESARISLTLYSK